MSRFHPTLRRLCALPVLLWAGIGFAQTTITQDKAMAGGVTPGDGAGFPITISQPGSYKLMSNLVVPAGMTAIDVQANDVTIDLNGFSISGPGTCYRPAWNSYESVCTVVTGTRAVTAPNTFNAVVRNGGISGFDVGVHVGAGTVESVMFHHNQTGAIVSGNASRLSLRGNKTGLKLIRGQADHCLALYNEIGFDADVAGESGLQSSQASFNHVGIRNLNTNGNLTRFNTTQLVATTAY